MAGKGESRPGGRGWRYGRVRLGMGLGGPGDAWEASGVRVWLPGPVGVQKAGNVRASHEGRAWGLPRVGPGSPQYSEGQARAEVL